MALAAGRTLSTVASVLMAMAAASLPAAAANTDVDALTALRKGLQDPGNALSSWSPNLVDPCTWIYVTCDGDNRVTRLDLGNLKLSGPLAPELGQLDRLQYMALYGNDIQGAIPSELGGLASLISLDLRGNGISGHIPAALGNLKSLRILRLNNNRLTGPIPRELAGLPNLQVADLSSNDLCGAIPMDGVFANIPRSSFDGNPRLHQGGDYEPNC
ncbi:hypothetical protein U9M48_044372 [Paspalum notatum var. saurae]|uniref:Leucine-rich repeat-containing N-terminal plant-type domain-containing protein n=1 Tax=Paspalum notatum var. saurae TaxID=547442 RepID=A0AAQ3V164_PASNO